MPRWEVSKTDSGLKLNQYLKLRLGAAFSQKQIKRVIDSGGCKINGKIEKFSSALVGYGDAIEFEMKEIVEREGSVLYEDGELLIYNKPANTTVESLEKKLGARLVHRLDKDTTGALILAKSAAIYNSMVQSFKEKQVHKTYLAIVDGQPRQKKGKIENYLGKLKSWQGQSLWGSVDPQAGEHAITEWKSLRIGPNYALLECNPITGRTHQIRAHLAEIGHPILGDKQYGERFNCLYPAPRTMLHAYKLRFPHPVMHTLMEIEAPIPEDFNQAIQTLWKGQ